ncbi:hypothetical protein MSHO_29270 [Mycobacterium shottsii]|uniref:FtsK domain-containing protein n=1 Tax=Mycobacterium shottsii TaxID=133549 RepID=A0A7I7LDG8_9MYCO|nr:hypothetical protein MSHO_29270 [Mycobacterium shottsii]
MVYPNITQASAAFDAVALPVMVIVDTDEHGKQLPAGVTVLEVGRGHDGTQVVVKRAGEATTLTRPDELDQASALVCARLLAPHRCGDRAGGHPGDWAKMLGIGEIATYHPVNHWHKRNQRERLCVPIGATADGSPVLLDIKEPAARGMGPHGLCIGATGSGKSELLRTVALGMMVRNSPEVLNLLLIDFKGGATFLDLEKAPHVAAVITNLADQAPLVARMGEALAGEMNRRQHLLRTAGNFVSVAAYEDARRVAPAWPRCRRFSSSSTSSPNCSVSIPISPRFSSPSAGWADHWACTCYWPASGSRRGDCVDSKPTCPIACASRPCPPSSHGPPWERWTPLSCPIPPARACCLLPPQS